MRECTAENCGRHKDYKGTKITYAKSIKEQIAEISAEMAVEIDRQILADLQLQVDEWSNK